MKNHYIFGTYGDNVYYLCLMKMLGGGNLFVKLNYLDYHCTHVIGPPYSAGLGLTGKLKQYEYDFMAPFLESQDYIHNVAVWNNEPLDYNIDGAWEYHLIKGWQGNIPETYALTLGMNILDPDIQKKLWYEPWLTPVEPIRIPGKPVIVNRTPRHLFGTHGSGWSRFIANKLSDYGVFVGHENEHADFEQKFGISIQHHKCSDMLEVARLIQGAEMFIGNQSMALSLAIGFGKTYFCEIRGDWQHTRTPHGGYGDVWFPRTNGHYFT